MKHVASAAFLGFGEINTPAETIEKKCKAAKELLENHKLKITSFSIVNDDPAGKSSDNAIRSLQMEDFDFIVVCIAGWIPSWAVIKILHQFSHKPMLLWGLTGYYEDGRLLTTADQAGTTALRKVFEDMGFNYKYTYNMTDSPPDMQKITNFAKACSAINLLKKSKVGMMGYRDMKLYGTTYNGISLRREIGIEVEHFEMLEIVQNIKKIDTADINEVLEKIKKDWVFEKPIQDATLVKGIEFYISLSKKIKEEGYHAISLIDVDGMKKLVEFPPAMIFTLLADEIDVCTIPENDTLGSVTQLMSKYLTGQISAYMEFYEFMEDRVLMGVPDFVPSEIVDGKLTVTPTKFGDFDNGVLNISKVKTGTVTLARLATKNDRYIMHILNGEAISPRKWEEIGWTPPAPQLPSLEIKLDVQIDDFAQKVLSQHYIITYGNNTGSYEELCSLLNIEII
jgi:L-fucose isomerase-like protein